MSLLTALKHVGKDATHFGDWIVGALKVIEPAANAAIAIAEPELLPIVQQVEGVVNNLQIAGKSPLSAGALQALTQAVTTLHTLAPGVITIGVVKDTTKIAGAVQGAVNAAEAEIKPAAPAAQPAAPQLFAVPVPLQPSNQPAPLSAIIPTPGGVSSSTKT